MRRHTIILTAAIAAAALHPRQAHAFQVASAYSEGCHERMVIAAAQTAGWPDGAAAPPLDEQAARIDDDSFYPLPAEARNLWMLALVAGVRHPDIGGRDVSDLVGVAIEAAEPGGQAAHCLRAPWHDHVPGDEAALQACRAHILQQVAAALGPSDAVELSASEEVTITLVFRGPTEVSLNRYAFRMGVAMHALEDSFSHAFRKGARVSHVLNYVDYVGGDYHEPRDGHEHMSHLDRCTDDLAAQQLRVHDATLASTEILAAVADPTGGREGRLARADEVLDRWMSLQPGCTYANDYCDAAELREPVPGACTTTGKGSTVAAAFWLFGLVVLGCRARSRRGSRATTAGLAALLALGARTSSADEAKAPETDDEDAASLERVHRGIGFYLGGAGSLDQASVAVATGLRVELARGFAFGLDGEFNPWLSIEGNRAALGTTNVFVPLIFTWAELHPVEFRSTLQGGISILNFDLVGADRGSVGPFAATTPLGIAVRATPALRVVIDPGGLVFSVPQTKGVPLIYRQHRISVGIQVTP